VVDLQDVVNALELPGHFVELPRVDLALDDGVAVEPCLLLVYDHGVALDDALFLHDADPVPDRGLGAVDLLGDVLVCHSSGLLQDVQYFFVHLVDLHRIVLVYALNIFNRDISI
jgi:hypothetical protein